ncbi:BON domain-containing protein [Rhizobium sp. 9140]|uniref:BON domain-containing protein n=1 Tax=Rhizobium sp. 9140 TaxID=1761900 RepID=UPI0007937308|nr:BON domain-containing protein [Rhizobium sp. 9140]CZT34292.1 BON domain-containing protein [Rhizobium sp. 9140]
MIEKTTRREEDYRDYEDRDLKEGWPYADDVSGSPVDVANRSYGETPESFDESGNPGFETSDETVRIGHGGPDILRDDPEADTDDDGLEEALSNALEEHEIDTSAVEIKVLRGVAELSGEVETAADRRAVEELAYRIPGISKVRNDLTTIAVDAAFPSGLND